MPTLEANARRQIVHAKLTTLSEGEKLTAREREHALSWIKRVSGERGGVFPSGNTYTPTHALVN